MLRTILRLAPLFFLAAAAQGQDPTTIWNSLAQPAFDPAKTAIAENIVITRDRIKITLAEGQIQFSQPVNGRVYGAAFRGRGRVEVVPPNPLEVQQLLLLTGKKELDMEFTEAAFSFSDDTFAEMSRDLKWRPGAGDLGAIYSSRQEERESLGDAILPRLFKALLSANAKRPPLFFADLKTKDKDWLEVRYDAQDIEEVRIGRWTQWVRHRGYDTWMHFPAGGRRPMDVDADPKAQDDFVVYGFKIDATLTGGAELRAVTRVNMEARTAGERAYVFDLDSNLRVSSVKTAQDIALPFFQAKERKDGNQSTGDYVAITLPGATTAGQKMELEFQYAGKRVVRKVGSGVYFCQSSGWYPTLGDSFSGRYDFEMTFRSPKRYTLVATGSKVSDAVEGDNAVSVWKGDIPLAVAGFAFGEFKVYKDKANNTDIEVYANKNPDDFMAGLLISDRIPRLNVSHADQAPLGSLSPSGMAKTMGIEMANTVKVFEAYFGPYPYKRLAVTSIPYSYGQGWPTLIYLSVFSFMDSTQRNAFGITKQIELTDFWRGHESSHQWWGHRVGWKTYHDQWLSEGFAEFSGNLYAQYRENMGEYLRLIRSQRERLLASDQKSRSHESLGPIWMGTRLSSSDAPEAYSVVIYEKGGLVLHTLRMMLYEPGSKQPDARFMAMMQDFTKTFDNKPASTEDFKAVAEKYMTRLMDAEQNHKLDWFFRQYVYGTGIPRYSFNYQLGAPANGQTKVSATLTRGAMPAGWKDILAVYGEVGGQMKRLGWITAVEKETKLEFAVPSQVTKLQLNVYEDSLVLVK